MRALIVDDSRFVRQYVRQMLEGMGVNCEEAEDGGGALASLREGTLFDLMLLDVNMPGMNGLDCVKEVRDVDLQPAMKVMMVTTEVDNWFISRALSHGADEFLMKPFTPESLRDKLLLLGLDS